LSYISKLLIICYYGAIPHKASNLSRDIAISGLWFESGYTLASFEWR